MVQYVSTRGGGQPKSFSEVLLSGTAPDGGLYVPDQWPVIDRALMNHMQGLSYVEIALQIIRPFVGRDIDPLVLTGSLEQTYGSDVFDHKAIAPLVQAGPGAWILELFHGPTLSFKDYAMQFLGRLFDYVLQERGSRITIVGATSGDTGSAAIEACKGCHNIDIFILHPHERVSEAQRRQLTSVGAPNVHNIAIEGTFDDCQALVKDMFGDEKMRSELNLSAVNSINWARIMAQIVYYFTAALALGAPGRPVSFAVPTGNFGNVYACWAAQQMGLPVHKTIVATNSNDILTRFFESGKMEMDQVVPSLSPSMDIQVSSNFERYLYELCGGNTQSVSKIMGDFKTQKAFGVPEKMLARARQDFTAVRSDDEQTLAMMALCYAETGMLIDPHTAVALRAGAMAAGDRPDVPLVVISSAHPAKFPDAVEKATGQKPPVPPRLAAVMKKAEHYAVLANDPAKIRAYIYQQREENN